MGTFLPDWNRSNGLWTVILGERAEMHMQCGVWHCPDRGKALFLDACAADVADRDLSARIPEQHQRQTQYLRADQRFFALLVQCCRWHAVMRAALVRLLPRSLSGRMTLILVLGLFAAQAVSLLLHLQDRASPMEAGQLHPGMAPFAAFALRFIWHVSLTFLACDHGVPGGGTLGDQTVETHGGRCDCFRP